MRIRPGRRTAVTLVWIALLLPVAVPGAIAVVGGTRESFPGTSIGSWGGGATLTNPGTGGVNGVNDGYLQISRTTLGNLGAMATVPYAGNWLAAGITAVSLWLDDVNAADNLEIHFSFGDPLQSFWQYNVGFLPPHDTWGQFVVDVRDSANWTETIGTASFAAALQNVVRIHVRHDKAPYMQTPDPTVGDVGLDELFLIAPGAAGVGLPARPAAPRPVELAAPWPNPSHGPVALRMVVPDGGAVTLEIADVGGRVVRRAVLPAGAPGARAWTWDGADDRGRAVPPGVYRARALGRSGGTSRALVRVR